MKIIDLLNKIANGEQPKHIRVYDEDWYWNDYDGYVTKWSLSTTPDAQHYLFSQYRLDFVLNKEVEVIDNEKWKTIVDFPNYEISTKGNIRTKQYCDKKGHIRQSKLLNKQINNCGYEYVILSNEFVKHKTLTVHRLAAKTFLDDYYDTLDVNHINGIKTDNRICNLEMVTHDENIKKRYEIGNDGNNYKAVEQFDLDGNYIATYKSSYEAEKMTGIGRTCIGGCCRNKHHTAGGYIWQFKIEEDNEIEKLDIKSDEATPNSYYILNEHGTKCYLTKHSKVIADKVDELIDKVNKLEKEE